MIQPDLKNRIKLDELKSLIEELSADSAELGNIITSVDRFEEQEAQKNENFDIINIVDLDEDGVADEEVVEEEEKVPEKKVDKVQKVKKVLEPVPIKLSDYLIKPIRKKTNKIYVKE